MGKIAKCCCGCPTCSEFATATAEFTWQGQDFSHPIPELDPELCGRTECISEPSWTVWHEEALVGPWERLRSYGRAGCNCIFPGYFSYTSEYIQTQFQIVQRFKMWLKRQWSTTLLVRPCDGGVRFVVVARPIHLWPWNATILTRDRYRIVSQSCNPNGPVAEGLWTEIGTDDGLEPGFPPVGFDTVFGCDPQDDWPSFNCESGDIAPTTITATNYEGFNTCNATTISVEVDAESECTTCPSILFPNGQERNPWTVGIFEYYSECYACGDVPSTMILTIPGRTSSFTYNPEIAPPCTWLTSFPFPPTLLTIPHTLSLTLVP